ncbi:MAG: hypothetical protein ABIR58_09965 [Gemmatimonadaceae bacterium]
MSSARPVTPGTTRACPHCKATILDSALVCPVCRHHLRFDQRASESAHPSFSALRVEGALRHPATGEAWEYSMLLTIRNDKGDEIARQIVGVGALLPDEQRTFTLSVDVFTPAAPKVPGAGGRPGR